MQQDNDLVQAYLGILFKGIGKLVELKFKNGKSAVGIFGGLNHSTMELLVRNMCYENAERNESKSVINFHDLEFFVVKHSPPTEQAQKQKSFKAHKADTVVKGRSSNVGKDIPEKQHDAPRGIPNDVFRTDTEISKRTAEGKESKKEKTKVFKRFLGVDIQNGKSLEDERLDGFDQFSANKLHFGIESKFNENDYTTELDISKLTRQQIQRANKAAEEIMASAISGIPQSRHLLEERNLIDLQDNDNENEEALYSAVVREEVTPQPGFTLHRKDKPQTRSFRSMVSESFSKARAPLPVTTPPPVPEPRLLNELVSDQPRPNTYFPVQPMQPQYFHMPQNQMYMHPQFMQGQPYYNQNEMLYYQANAYNYAMPQGFPNGPVRR